MPQPNDLSRSLVALDQNSTIIAVLEMSQSSWRWQPYYTDRELELDRRIHAFGLLLALIATPLLLGLAAESSMARAGPALRDLSVVATRHARSRRRFATRRSDGPIIAVCGASTTLRSFCSSPALTNCSR